MMEITKAVFPGAACRPLADSAVLVLLLAVVSGCGGGAKSAKDSSPPTFAGVQSASSLSNSITLSWGQVSEKITATQNIVYLVYRANSSGAENYSSPTYTSERGALSYTDSGLAAGVTYYYVVKSTTPSFPRRRESSLSNYLRAADKAVYNVLSHCVGMLLIGWIPACAGMTAFVWYPS